jgi:hypothetical protein
MTVNKTQGPSADDYRAALDSLFAPPGQGDASSANVDLLPGGAAKPEDKQTSFGELGKQGVKFGQASESGASGQVVAKEGVGTGTTVNPEFNRSPGARAAMAHGGLLSLSRSEPGRLAWTPKLPDRTGHVADDRKPLAHTPSDQKLPKGPQAYQVHSPMTYGVHDFDGTRTPAFRSAPLTGMLEYTKPQGRGILFPYDPQG